MTQIEDLVLKHRDIYMNYRDLADRCFIDINQIDSSEKKLYYMVPDSPFLDEPEKLKGYRQQVLKQVSTVSQPEPVLLMAHELQKQAVMDLDDHSQPEKAKEDLYNFYRRRANQLRYQKTRVLQRWAHNAFSSEKCDKMVQEMNYYLGKMQMEIELCVKRYQRLQGHDDFARAKVHKRPSTKAKVGGSLYVENLHPPPISSIRQDDIEVWMRRQTYLNKCFRVFYKLIDKLKWIAMQSRFEIFEESVLYIKGQREESLEDQKDHIDELAAFAKKDIKRKLATEKNLEDVKNTYHYVIYREKVIEKSDEIKFSINYDHERLPGFVSNSIELTFDVLNRSNEYDIHGNIDLDQGYSFLYQIAIFFPMHFQKQVVKTTFEPYDINAISDEFSNNLERVNDFKGKAGEKIPMENMMRGTKPDDGDEDEEEKVKLPTMTPLDSISELKSNAEYKNVISPQLKVSDWLHFVGRITPQTKDYMKRQIAVLNNDNPIDLLLKFSYDMTCGVQDVSIMNALVEDISKKHQLCVDGSLKQFMKAKEFEEVKYKDTTQLYSQFMDALENNLRLNFEDAFNVIKTTKRLNKKSDNYFFRLPDHMLHAYYMLRHLKIRDFKTKILYALNYFRSIQKRFTLDLEELYTRDKVVSDQELKPPTDATRISKKNISNDTSAGAAGASKKHQLEKAKAALEKGSDSKNKSENADYNYVQSIYQKAKDMNVEHEKAQKLDDAKNPIDQNKYRYKEKVHNKFISTCPIMSRYHTSFGYTTQRVSIAEEIEYSREYEDNIEVTAKKFMGRNDFVEFNEEEEILIKDDFGIHIMYDCAESDLDLLKDELLITGSYFIKRQEPLTDAENTERLSAIIDRVSCLELLMKYEAKYQYKKAELVRLYMETYEHVIDPVPGTGEMERFIQLVTDIMAERPRLNLDSNSFEDSYKLEIEILEKKIEILQNIVRFQITQEKKINANICDYIEKAHRMVIDNLDKKWDYKKPEDINEEYENRGLVRENINVKENSKTDSQKDENTKVEHKSKFSSGKNSPTRDKSPTKGDMEEIFKKKRKGLIGLEDEPEDRFSQALGLPKISQDDIYKRYRENDHEALDIMNEHSSFIRNEDHYPRRFRCEKGDYKLDNTMTGEDIGILDFYESLGYIHWLQNMLDESMKELISVHKPFNNYRLASIELKLLAKTLSKISDVKDQENNNVFEYEGKSFIEDD